MRGRMNGCMSPMVCRFLHESIFDHAVVQALVPVLTGPATSPRAGAEDGAQIRRRHFLPYFDGDPPGAGASILYPAPTSNTTVVVVVFTIIAAHRSRARAGAGASDGAETRARLVVLQSARERCERRVRIGVSGCVDRMCVCQWVGW